MRISAKGRYGLAAMASLAKSYNGGAPVTIIRISEELGISKIYLEQVFSLLKRAKLVTSLKGSQGGYQLSRRPGEISAYDILAAIELGLLEVPDKATEKVPLLDHALATRIYQPLDQAIHDTLASVTLEDILAAVDEESAAYMYFI